MSRAPCDVVIPFAGSDQRLQQLMERARQIQLRDGDTLTIVDNRANAGDRPPLVISAPAQQSSYHARNRGAERGSAPWIVFIDADVDPSPDLLDRYFDSEPGERVGVLAGGVEDEPLSTDEPTLAERFAVNAQQMSQENTLEAGSWSYAQTANAAIRREAFEQVGGFEEGIRSGGDADICFRLRVAGWELDSRPAAIVLHDNRESTRAFLSQKARHGAGAAWLEKRYPGSFPRRGRRELLRRIAREVKMGVPLLARGERESATDLWFATVAVIAFELGRLRSNRAPSR